MNVVALQKVLVADDDAINRQVLGEILMPDYTVLLAKNGSQALERAQRHLPDLILLDVMMPDMDGYEVLRQLRADPRTEHISVIFISGLDGPEDEANGLNSGASDYVTKPFNRSVVMARVALHLQLVRQRNMLERLANIDGLTELPNRRRFDEIYAAEWRRAKRAGLPLSLAMLDIDCFKQYNDHYGHPAGDRVLRVVARAMAKFMQRPGDMVARYGGEEFVLVMPGLDATLARDLAEQVREAIEQLAIAHVKSSLVPRITASIGGVSSYGHDSELATELLKAADDQLYMAKQAGRNRVLWRAPLTEADPISPDLIK